MTLSTSVHTIDIKREILGLNGVIYSGKVKRRIIEKYDLELDEFEESSLGHKIGIALREMCDAGVLDTFKYGGPGRPIKYIRKA